MAKENNFAFIDGQNLNLGIKSLGWKLDYARFRKYLSDKYSVVTAYYFIGYVAGNQPLYSELQKAGYILIFKPTIPDADGNIKGNIDADLVLQAMIDFINYDKAIIVSSDGDFYSLVKHLYKNNLSINEKAPQRDGTLRGAFSYVYFILAYQNIKSRI